MSVEKDVEAINAVYTKQAEKEEKEFQEAIKASSIEPVGKVPVTNTLLGSASTIKRPDTNRPVGKADTPNTNRTNPLVNRISTKKTFRQRIPSALVAALKSEEEHTVNPDTGMTADESASQWNCAECTFLNDAGTTNCGVCGTDKNVKKETVSTYKHNIVQNVEVFGYVNGAGIHYEQDNNKINDVHVIEITPEIQQMFETINAANTDNMNSKNHNEHKQEIGFKHLIDINNLGQWTEESQKVVAFVPKEQKRPPPATVEKYDNTNKTFINVSIHDWVCFGTEPNESNTITKYPFLKLDIPQGIEETVGNDIDIYPVTSKWTQLQYQIHNLDDDPASYSPDTGIIVLDDNFDGNPSCKIICVDVLTKRILRVELTFIRDEDTYIRDKDTYINHIPLNIGGKSRRTRKLRRTRKSRKQRRRRQTKRR